jgi:hypothetical protein
MELELIQTLMAQKPMLRAEVYARALRASHNAKRADARLAGLRFVIGGHLQIHTGGVFF